MKDEMRGVRAAVGEGCRAGTGIPGGLWRELTSGVALVATRDDHLLSNCTTALEELGLEVVTAYSPVTAEFHLRRHRVRIIVFDARILGPVCRARPGPILPTAERIPFIVTNASCLDDARRRLVTSYQASCVEDGGDGIGLVRVVAEALCEPLKGHFGVAQNRKRGRIVLVHSDSVFRRWLADALRDDGYCVSEHGAPSEVPAGNVGEAGIVVTEYRMQGENGLSFADRCHDQCPSVPVIMITTHWDHDFMSELKSREFLYYLRKPLDYSVLHGVIRDLSRPVRDWRCVNGACQ